MVHIFRTYFELRCQPRLVGVGVCACAFVCVCVCRAVGHVCGVLRACGWMSAVLAAGCVFGTDAAAAAAVDVAKAVKLACRAAAAANS